MIHRILEGPQALAIGRALFQAGELHRPPLDMGPEFVNCCRVFSKLEIVTPEQQHEFDVKCQEIGLRLGGVIVRHDVGAYLRFAGHEYS